MSKLRAAATILFLLQAFAGISQIPCNCRDTAWTALPNAKLRIAIVKIENGKIAIEENVKLHQRIGILQHMVYNRDSVIRVLTKIDKESSSIIAGHIMENGNLKMEVALTKDLNNDYKNQIRRWRGIVVKVVGVAIIVVAGLLYLITKK